VLTLAPDPAVPHRDALLSPDVVARLFLPAASCDRIYAKYRVGESLRVVHRLDGSHHVAARTFRAGQSAAAYERARERSVPAGPLPAVLHARDLDAVFWAFPNDRRLDSLPLLTSGSRALAELLGRPCPAVRLVAYNAERSASARCLDESGRTVAYVKVLAGDGAELERRRLEAAGPLAPRVLGASAEYGALALEPLDGRRLDSLRGGELAGALEGLGRALATLHAACPVPEQPFTRLEPERLASAVAVIARARPDAGRAAALVLAHLLSRIDDAGGPTVCLHGDATVRNAIADGRRVALLDLEHAAAGPAAADLGNLLAGLAAERLLGRISAAEARAFEAALVAGYAAVAPPPGECSLRWHANASLLARVAQSAINRVRPQLLRRLGPLLESAIA
jgi:aminoglycoside phosphotransferase